MLKALLHRHTQQDYSEELFNHHAVVLREYAKWSLTRGYVFPPSREAHRRELIDQFLQMGARVKLTERDMVLLLYRGIFQQGTPSNHRV